MAVIIGLVNHAFQTPDHLLKFGTIMYAPTQTFIGFMVLSTIPTHPQTQANVKWIGDNLLMDGATLQVL